MKPRMFSLLALLAVFSLLVAACGSDSDDSADEESTEASADDSGDTDDEAVDPTTFGTERPDGIVAGAVFDAMDFLTFDDQTAVCTAETVLVGTTEEELLAEGISAIEDNVVAAALDCGADEEAMESLRLTLQRSPLNEDQDAD